MESPERHGSRYTFHCGNRTFELASRTHIMGIVNVTPDSFSDGGLYLDPSHAIEHGIRLADEGADILDVGGESTRPRGAAYGEGAQPVGEQEELDRVLPVIEGLVKHVDTPVSVDTTKSGVARQAFEAGACMVNDISGFTFDPAMPLVAGKAGAAAVVMHIKGTPLTMQMNPEYGDLFAEIGEFLADACRKGIAAGIRSIMIDPGIGFGKTAVDNYRLLAGLGRFEPLGFPILVGPSRKSFLGAALGLPPEERLEGTLAAVTAAILHGANMVRVHDVREASRAAMVADAVRAAIPGAET
jgi:dihydropteroate synthase